MVLFVLGEIEGRHWWYLIGGGRDLDDFVAFINEKSGASRDGKGQLTSQVSEI